MTFKERLDLAPYMMIWIFIVLPVAIVLGDVAIFFYLIATSILCFWFAAVSKRRNRERRLG